MSRIILSSSLREYGPLDETDLLVSFNADTVDLELFCSGLNWLFDNQAETLLDASFSRCLSITAALIRSEGFTCLKFELLELDEATFCK